MQFIKVPVYAQAYTISPINVRGTQQSTAYDTVPLDSVCADSAIGKLLALEEAYERAEQVEAQLRLHLERYNASKSRLADQQHWSNRRAKVIVPQYEAELEAAQLCFASNRVALQRMRVMFVVRKDLVMAASAVRSGLVVSGVDPHLKRIAMNNIVMASQLEYRISRYCSIEWMPAEAEVREDPRAPERLTDVSFFAGIAALHSAIAGTSGAVTFFEWSEMSLAAVEPDATSAVYQDYAAVELAARQAEQFVLAGRELFAQFQASEVKQKEGTYQKRLKGAGSDQRKVQALRQEQARLRADTAGLKAALRNLPVRFYKEALSRALMPFHRASGAAIDLAIVNNVVRARQLLVAIYALENEVQNDCSYEDDVSNVGLLDLYNAEEGRICSAEFFYNRPEE